MDKFIQYKIKSYLPTFILLSYQDNKILIEFYKLNTLMESYKLISELHIPSLKEKDLIENILIQNDYIINSINNIWNIAVFQTENINVSLLKIPNKPQKRHKYFYKYK